MRKSALFYLLLAAYIVITFPAQQAFAFSVSKVKIIKERVYTYIPAEVISKTAVTIFSKIPGFVKNLHVDIGDKVKKGDILLTIDQNVSKQNVKQAVAYVAKADAQLKNATFNYNKFLNLYKKNVVSKQQFLNMETAYRTARGAYEQAVANLKAAQSTLRYSIIRSPVDGIISAKYVNNGDMASMVHPLLKISPLHSLQVKADIDEESLKYLQSTKTASVKIKDKNFKLKVTHISPSLDPVTRTLEIKIDLPDNIKAAVGEFARVVIPLDYRFVIAVDRRAVTTRGDINGVFVVGKNGKAEFRMVRFGKIYGEYIASLSGLFENETVVLNPPLSLKNGSVIVNEKQ